MGSARSWQIICTMLSLHFVHHNFVRKNMSLKMTPATAAAVSKSLHDMEWLVGLNDASAAKPGPRGPFRKR